jgi:hypothetical protein
MRPEPFDKLRTAPVEARGHPPDRSAIEAYRILIGSRIRSQLAYRASFWLNVATSVAVGLVEFVEIYAIFANVGVFGGLDLRQSAQSSPSAT